ncbi:MAG: hypothetical protein JWP12_2979 [Bacteroidetes bacterium]|nr:hypothetical protein [Bacteroidota bacterium]
MGPKSLLKKPWFLSGVVVAAIAVIATVVVLNQKPKTAPETTAVEQPAATDAALEAFYKAEEAKPCIAPPIKGLNVPYTVFNVNAQKGGVLDFKTGSKLTVPKNAFTDANGNPVKGDVELRYREFHDAADFFVSGIPMTYDSAGVKYQFESAGMMEMLAYQDGKPVNMAPGKTINVELASDYKGNEYNLYKLDTVKNNWSCLGKDKVVAASKPQGTAKPDTVKTMTVAQTREYKKIETQKVEAKTVKETQVAALPKPGPEPQKPQPVKKGRPTFNLDVDTKDFPEFAIYNGLLFEVGDENKNFSSTLYDVAWEDTKITEGSIKGKNYILTLQKGKQKVDLVVYPVFEGKNYETAIKEFQGKFDKYNTLLTKRLADEKRIEDEYQAKLLAFKEEQDALERKWKKQMDDRLATMTTQEKVMRVFTMSSFGVYNCDCPKSYPKGVLCNAKLANENKVDLMCYDVFLVDRHRNGLFSYYKNPVANFSFDPNSVNILWTVEEGKLYYLKPEDFAAVKSGDQLIKMNRVEQNFKTVDEMKAFFDL